VQYFNVPGMIGCLLISFFKAQCMSTNATQLDPIGSWVESYRHLMGLRLTDDGRQLPVGPFDDS